MYTHLFGSYSKPSSRSVRFSGSKITGVPYCFILQPRIEGLEKVITQIQHYLRRPAAFEAMWMAKHWTGRVEL